MNANKLIAVAAVAASASMPMAATATNIEVTTNSVTWRFMIPAPNGAAGTAMIGINPSTNGLENRDSTTYRAIVDGTTNGGISVDAASIPWQFDYEGTHYTVTTISLGAFLWRSNRTHAKLIGTLTIPDSVTEVRNHAFNGQESLAGFVGGKNVQSWGSGTSGGGIFSGCKNMVGVFPDFSQSTLFGDSIFQDTTKMTGTLKFSDLLTRIDYFAFQTVQAYGSVVIPASVDSLGNSMGANYNFGVFYKCPKLEAVWVKGKPANSQSYTTVYSASFVRECSSMKLVLFGRNTKGASINAMNGTSNVQRMLYGDSNVQLFVPANGYWDGLDAGGSNNKTWWYGPSEEFDLEINDDAMTATFTPTTVNALTNALSWVSDFKTHFNLDTRISVTNTLDFTGVTITEDTLKNVTFDRLMFSAKTQAQLDGILHALPATTPISIDPTGLTENMVIPETYNNVYVKTVPGVTIRRTTKGFMIIVK